MRLGPFIAACCFTLWAGAASASVKVQEFVSSDVTAWLAEDHSLPLITVKVAYGESGAAYDPAGKEGLAYFASQMLDEGAGDMDALAFHSALEDKAARFGVDAGEDLFIVSLQALSQSKKETLHLLTLALTKPRFDEDALTRTRAGILSELRQLEEDPGYLASLNWKKLAFPDHPYQHPRHGTLASVGTMGRKDLQSFAAAHLGCGRKFVVVVGDMNAQEVKDWLATLPSKACAAKAASVADISIQGRAEPVRIFHDVPQTVVAGGLPAVGHSDPRYYALTVLNYILGGDPLTSRLGREIRDKRGLAYSAESHIEEMKHAAFISLHFATRAEQTEKAWDVFKDVLATLAKGTITDAEVNEAKNYLTGSFPLQIDSQGSLAEYLISVWHRGLGADYLERRGALIEAVTTEQVNNAARTFLPAAPLVVMVGRTQGAHTP